MDYQVLFNIVLGLAGFLGGWALNNVTKAIERLDSDVRAMPHTYVSKDDWRAAMKEVKDEMVRGFDRLEENLNNVFSKLDKKEDKS